MNNGRYTKHSPARRRKLSKRFLLTLSLVLVLSTEVGGTVAYLTSGSETVQNTFVEGTVSCSVGSDYTVENTGTVDAKIRAAVVVNFVKNGDSNTILGTAPAYTLTLGSGWTDGGDGYYYYTPVVLSKGVTSAVCTVSANNAPDGYVLSVEILAEAIQADGRTGTWGEAPTN